MNIKLKLQTALVLMALAAVSGCDSDPVAPHDELPALSAKDTANQAAMVVMAATVMGPVILDGGISGKDATELINFNNPNGIMGTAHLEYFLGGPNGEASTSEAADFAHLYTMQGMPMMLELGLGGGVSMGFDLTGDIDQMTSSAVISGSGSFMTGPHEATFSIDDVLLETTSEYPSDGAIVFQGPFYEVTAFCDGTDTAVMQITDGPSFTMNLDTGEVSDLSDED